MKILKGIGGTPWSGAVLGKYEEHSPRYPKNTFPEFYHIKLFAFNIKWTVVYRIRNGLEVYYFYFLFNSSLIKWSKWEHTHFPQLAGKGLRSLWDFQINMTIYILF